MQTFSRSTFDFQEMPSILEECVYSCVLDLVAVGNSWLAWWINGWLDGGGVREFAIVLCPAEATQLMFG